MCGEKILIEGGLHRRSHSNNNFSNRSLKWFFISAEWNTRLSILKRIIGPKGNTGAPPMTYAYRHCAFIIVCGYQFFPYFCLEFLQKYKFLFCWKISCFSVSERRKKYGTSWHNNQVVSSSISVTGLTHAFLYALLLLNLSTFIVHLIHCPKKLHSKLL